MLWQLFSCRITHFQHIILVLWLSRERVVVVVVVCPHSCLKELLPSPPLLLVGSYTLTESAYILPRVKFIFIPELWLFPGKFLITFTPTKTNLHGLVLLLDTMPWINSSTEWQRRPRSWRAETEAGLFSPYCHSVLTQCWFTAHVIVTHNCVHLIDTTSHSDHINTHNKTGQSVLCHIKHLACGTAPCLWWNKPPCGWKTFYIVYRFVMDLVQIFDFKMDIGWRQTLYDLSFVTLTTGSFCISENWLQAAPYEWPVTSLIDFKAGVVWSEQTWFKTVTISCL